MKQYLGKKIVTARPMEWVEFTKIAGRPCEDRDNEPGYLVVYPPENPFFDGYTSWSPKSVFEKAYHATDEGMDFGEALMVLKAGMKVARRGWNGKNMWICLMPPVFIAADSVNERTRRHVGKGNPLDCQAYIVMRTAQGKWQPGWLASQNDLLAEDWVVVADDPEEEEEA